jgi:hypothetical protein
MCNIMIKKSHSHLPDIVNDCEQRVFDNNIKITCKEIAHSLRLVADQVDKKYCQVSQFNFLLINIHSFFVYLGY